MPFEKFICKDCLKDYETIKNESARMVVKHNEKYLMISTKRGDLIFPGGTIELGESKESCAVRELIEETGYHVLEELTFLGKVTTRRLDRYDKNKAFEAHAYFYTAALDETIKTEPKLTKKEIKYELKSIWLTKEEIIKRNKAYNESLKEKDLWVEQVEYILSQI